MGMSGDDGTPPEPHQPERFATVGLFLLGLMGAFYFLRSIILPIVMAMLLSYLLTPVIRAMQRLRIPTAVASALLLLVAIAAISALASLLATPAVNMVQKAPENLRHLEQKLAPLRKPLEKLFQTTGEVETLVTPPQPAAPAPAAPPASHAAWVRQLFGGTAEFVVHAVTTIILLYFLLAYSGLFTGRLIKVIPRLSDKKTAMRIVTQIEEKISRYLLTVTAINFCLGVAVGTAVALLKLPNPLLWGAAVFAFKIVCDHLPEPLGVVGEFLRN